jgi:hypothetical protein
MSRIPGVELGTTCWQLLGHHTVLEYIPRGFPAEILGNIHFQVFPFGAGDYAELKGENPGNDGVAQEVLEIAHVFNVQPY